ncbi:MAG: tRNA pseudouridine(38-40) synthase TruA [Planctomycetota bacterium]
MTSDPRLRTLRLDLSWSGTDFAGWQRQPGQRTVQGVVEEALAHLVGEAVSVVGCGRTDAGTHAWHHVSSLRTRTELSVEDIERALEALLPEDVSVVQVADAAPVFHAQRDALWKWYRYRVLVSRRRQPLAGSRAWRRRHAPARGALQAAVDPLRGRHDFASFANLGSTPGATVRTLHAVTWHAGTAQGDEAWSQGAPYLALDVVGDGFLWKMVRTIVGTAWRAAAANDPAAVMRAVLAARDRRAAGPATPADGLTLMAVAVAGDPPPELPAHLAAAWRPGGAAAGAFPSSPESSPSAPEGGVTGASPVPRRPS